MTAIECYNIAVGEYPSKNRKVDIMEITCNKLKSAARRLTRLIALSAAMAMLFSACVVKHRSEQSSTSEPRHTEAPTEKPTEAPTEPPYYTPSSRPWKADGVFSEAEKSVETQLDYFAIPDAIFDLISEGDKTMYALVVGAYFRGENEVNIPEGTGEHKNLLRLLDIYCPVFFTDVEDTSITETDGKFGWEYKRGVDHGEAIAAFEKSVKGYLDASENSGSFIMRALEIYKALTGSIEYDGTNEVENDETTPYVYRYAKDALMDGHGVCWCFARAYTFLLAQIGAEAFTVHGLRNGDDAIHEWSVFMYEGEWCYADPTWDIGGTTLEYFGFSPESRRFSGYREERVHALELNEKPATELFEISTRHFYPLYTSLCWGEDYRLDKEKQLVVFVNWRGADITAFDPHNGTAVPITDAP